MSASTAPSPAANPGLRRSLTLPAHLSNHPRSTSSGSPAAAAADGVETLFNHTFAKVVLFSPASSLSRPSSSASNRTIVGDNDVSGTIPWVSPTESTVAAGPIRIYRVPGSVAFLHSGSLLHAILPKSQCWCVDGVSRFALRIPRPNSYYRIELPDEGEENLAKVDELKGVLEKVLQYEKTVCPFSRGFHVEIPKTPETPRRRQRPVTPGRAKKWKLDGFWRPETGERPVSRETEKSYSSEASTVSPSSENFRRSSVCTTSSLASSIDENEPPLKLEASEHFSPQTAVRHWIRPVETARSFTAPVGTPFNSASMSSSGGSAEDLSDPNSDAASIISTTDSFYSLSNESNTRASGSRQTSQYFDTASIYRGSTSPPEQPEAAPDVEASHHSPGTRHKRDISELTITAHMHLSEDERSPFTPRDEERQTSAPSTPTLISDSESAVDFSMPEDVATPPDTIRLRRLTSTSDRRAFSPMPHPANLFTPPAPASHPRKEFTTALVQKTMGLLIGPPAHLVALMLRIAARIANGSFTPDSWSLRRNKKIPGAWQWSEDEADEWDDEDDYGIPLGNYQKRESAASSGVD